MDFSNLSKQQKDRLVLMVMGGVLFLAGIGYGVKSGFSISTRVEDENKILEKKIIRAEGVGGKQRRLLKKAQEISAELKIYATEAPPEKNYYSWASELLYALAKKVSFKIDRIEKQGSTSVVMKGKGKKSQKDALKISTSLKIVAHGEYETCLNFLKMMEKEYPLARVVSIEINLGENIEIHNVDIVIQWPSNLAYLLHKKSVTKGVKP